MMMPLQFVNIPQGASIKARVFALSCGLFLFAWSLLKIRKRTLLISTCSMFIAVGVGLMLFAVFPSFYDAVSYAVGIQYPPLMYMVLAILVLMMIIIHLASRVSLLDERCRKLAQELALLQVSQTNPEETASGGKESIR